MNRNEARSWLKQNLGRMPPKEYGKAWRRYAERFIFEQNIPKKLAVKEKTIHEIFDGGL